MQKRATRCWLKCSGWILRESDTPDDVRIKRTFSPVVIILSFVVLIQIAYAFQTTSNVVYIAGMFCILVAALVFLTRGCAGSDMRSSLDMMIPCVLLGVLLADAFAASELRPRSWVLVILILDVTLVFNIPKMIPLVLSLTLAFLLLERMEAVTRFGFYEVAASESPPACACADPPCSVGLTSALNHVLMFCVVISIDFYLTRGFATKLRFQLRCVQSAVDVAGAIAAALAKYDVDGAERNIVKAKDLPKELVASYWELLSNLRSYRDYLPESLLQQQEEDTLDSPRGGIPPPVGGEAVGMVFTDIQSSTALWEEYPESMLEALH
eukprot:Hpha_TRINITY_DN16406_c3_g15::TRINITY_DN16406_c3_g15_i1::g.160206::m.160206